MAGALIAAVGLLALVVFVLAGAVLELNRDVRQLREVAGILDRPLDVDVGHAADEPPSRYGLPSGLDSAASALVLFLSDRCGTCHALAAGLGESVPRGLLVVVEGRSPASADEFLATHGLEHERSRGRLLVDATGEISGRMGLRTTPVALRVEDGRIVGGTTVPSRRYLNSIVPNRVRLEPPDSPEHRERRAS